MKTSKIELNTLELITLYNSLYTAKFLHYGFHSWKVAFDKNAGELLLKIDKQIEINLEEETGKKRVENRYFDLVKNNYDYEKTIETAKKHLSEFDEWIEYKKEEKEELVKNLLYPLNYQNETFKELMEYANSYFSN
ncbi:hypothetical protein WAF17_12200 [Bernardetia sp. ABR2-2B]|uniref:hypothetical protein n=1 Tax=Bernardetia sp. ABR2-2B TaxID=3127472 RepID=UPI0030CE56F5